jgi:hypothetical protein
MEVDRDAVEVAEPRHLGLAITQDGSRTHGSGGPVVDRQHVLVDRVIVMAGDAWPIRWPGEDQPIGLLIRRAQRQSFLPLHHPIGT